MIRKIPLVLCLISCWLTTLSANINMHEIRDLALVYGNVKYYYPQNKMKDSDWNKLTSYLLSTWYADSTGNKSDRMFYAYVVQKYAEAGLKINLYEKVPPAVANSSEEIKGRHWNYRGYPFSKNKYIAGPFLAAFYNSFENPYHKYLKKNSPDYFKPLKQGKHLLLHSNEVIVKLSDSLWLGLPLDAVTNGQSAAFKSFKSEYNINNTYVKIAYVIDVWNVLYHFCPTVEPKNAYLQHVENAAGNILNGVSLLEVTENLMSATNDAHANLFLFPIISGSFYKIGNEFYYREKAADGIRIWKVLRYKGQNPQSAYLRALQRVSSPNPEAKANLALRKMREVISNSDSISLLLQDIKNSDTVTVVRRHERGFVADLGGDHSQGNVRVVDSARGIYYLDLKNVSSKRVLKTLGAATCKVAIIDVRGHPYLDPDFLNHIITEQCSDLNYAMPVYSYPDKNSIVYDTTFSHNKTAKNQVHKIIIALCDETSVSFAENILATLKNCGGAVIIGRPTAGTTGNIVVAPVYTNPGYYDLIPFTPVIFLNVNGSPFTGITPDVLVKQSLENLINNEDEIFKSAFSYAESISK